jgi:hypothetical protein
MSGNPHPAKKGYTPKGGTFSSRLSTDMGQLKKSNKELLEMALHAHHRIEELRQRLDEARPDCKDPTGVRRPGRERAHRPRVPPATNQSLCRPGRLEEGAGLPRGDDV